VNIYAIRDRLLNYYQAPFAAHTDQDVLHALTVRINTDQGRHDLVQKAPHHFEIWKLGSVQEDGHLIGRPEFLADLSTLIRATPGRKSARPGEEQVLEAQIRSRHQAYAAALQTAADKRPAPEPPQAEDRQGTTATGEPRPTAGLGNN